MREGLEHVAQQHPAMRDLIQRHGLPSSYSCVLPNCRHETSQTTSKTSPTTSFQSLCRIVVGQFISGKAARAFWTKLLKFVNHKLTPQMILKLVQSKDNVQVLKDAVGTNRTKSECIFELANQFDRQELSEQFLSTASVSDVRSALLKVKGIGPWSVDMFLLFYLERPDIMPLGDAAVLGGLEKTFAMRGSRGKLCGKRDKVKIMKVLQPMAPYHSLVAFYMYRVTDSPSVATTEAEVAAGDASNKTTDGGRPHTESPTKRKGKIPLSTPTKKRPRRSTRLVTPSSPAH